MTLVGSPPSLRSIDAEYHGPVAHTGTLFLTNQLRLADIPAASFQLVVNGALTYPRLAQTFMPFLDRLAVHVRFEGVPSLGQVAWVAAVEETLEMTRGLGPSGMMVVISDDAAAPSLKTATAATDRLGGQELVAVRRADVDRSARLIGPPMSRTLLLSLDGKAVSFEKVSACSHAELR